MGMEEDDEASISYRSPNIVKGWVVETFTEALGPKDDSTDVWKRSQLRDGGE